MSRGAWMMIVVGASLVMIGLGMTASSAAAQDRVAVIAESEAGDPASLVQTARVALSARGTVPLPDSEIAAARAFLGLEGSLDDAAVDRLREQLGVQAVWMLRLRAMPDGGAALSVAARSAAGTSNRFASAPSMEALTEVLARLIGELSQETRAAPPPVIAAEPGPPAEATTTAATTLGVPSTPPPLVGLERVALSLLSPSQMRMRLEVEAGGETQRCETPCVLDVIPGDVTVRSPGQHLEEHLVVRSSAAGIITPGWTYAQLVTGIVLAGVGAIGLVAGLLWWGPYIGTCDGLCTERTTYRTIGGVRVPMERPPGALENSIGGMVMTIVAGGLTLAGIIVSVALPRGRVDVTTTSAAHRASLLPSLRLAPSFVPVPGGVAGSLAVIGTF